MSKKILYTLGIIGAAAVAGFGYYAVSPLFRHIVVDEPAPVVSSSEPVKTAAENDTPPAMQIMGTTGHPASGSVRLIEGEEKAYVRYENLKTINGPDLYVYLANDLDAKDFVSLGKLKATEGNVNYEVPQGVDVHAYRYVMTWCKQFGVLFNYADISTASSE